MTTQRDGEGFARFFTSRAGKVFDAWDYGHKAWPIGKSNKPKKTKKK